MNEPIRTYSELIRLPTFEERYRYLRLGGIVGESTFGFDRYLNQYFYSRNSEWKAIRRDVIIRDSGCDLGDLDREIHGKILIHHMNPITVNDIINHETHILDPEFLITTSLDTHNAIHYGDESLLAKLPAERMPFDTCPWRST